MPSYDHARLCQQIVDGAMDAVIFADREGVIRLWNSGAEKMFGYSSSEALGQSLDIIIPERLRDRHWSGYRQVMASGVTRYGEQLLAVPAVRKDGTRISIEFTIVLVRDEKGEPIGSAAVIRDVTVRWQKEKELKEKLAALESQSK
ncbi:PAS domain-containing protein [Desulfoferrobacter suflitae]|uniref:PAS domain-containing protein n=1 Tax=Desulfoferrobacter suflitae TaxID=2865782 RepID=UPI00216477AA|nr:PAS domain S-box protein [Desulfoferrobacter suflitae]MCK8604287.1 PAS domain S-box protein [Desulfoferrobacter suflitae]